MLVSEIQCVAYYSTWFKCHTTVVKDSLLHNRPRLSPIAWFWETKIDNYYQIKRVTCGEQCIEVNMNKVVTKSSHGSVVTQNVKGGLMYAYILRMF